ncbi:uncharacterized protein BO80DRAFT_30613 [Aspergillus ibericus CBS 121593]|uniref:Uncharacterized protein n=1 Tax=Aspergillus ibericus CBS 121593 TaxID=1448316 RepID=A0A395H514_9EURO|nr:hypothetical protein BO80DRAFT_30613 [Aspergillus ibericus CBS 121593]RAL02770.1 hypothetical protein BO80DRAFT_30613 [Aspergillus ibericus CBS 121593]
MGLPRACSDSCSSCQLWSRVSCHYSGDVDSLDYGGVGKVLYMALVSAISGDAMRCDLLGINRKLVRTTACSRVNPSGRVGMCSCVMRTMARTKYEQSTNKRHRMDPNIHSTIGVIIMVLCLASLPELVPSLGLVPGLVPTMSHSLPHTPPE